jgi:hypothetical protein
MFDEVNDGTAMMKVVRERSQAPNELDLVVTDFTPG